MFSKNPIQSIKKLYLWTIMIHPEYYYVDIEMGESKIKNEFSKTEI